MGHTPNPELLAQVSICPRCANMYMGTGALSRVDNQTVICSGCGTDEGMRTYLGMSQIEGFPYSDAIWEDLGEWVGI